jgi:hypothetical protein
MIAIVIAFVNYVVEHTNLQSLLHFKSVPKFDFLHL